MQTVDRRLAPEDRPVAVDAAVAAHLDALRLDPRGVNRPGWRVDWDDGPWPVTIRSGGARIGLRAAPDDPLLDRVGRLVRGAAAIGRVRAAPGGGLPATPEDPFPHRHGSPIGTRRPVPSGGSMYPTELYALLPGPGRVLHVDPYRHELVDLARPYPPGLPPAAAVLVLTLRYWKNVYKYGDFAFRLGAVDAGVGLGRVLRLGRALFGRADVLPDADDGALGAALRLDPAEEGVQAVVVLGTAPGPAWTPRVWSISGTPPRTVERSRHVRRLSRFDAARAAASAPAPAAGAAPPPADLDPVVPALPLPAPLPVDLLDADLAGRRTSNGRLFRPEPAPAEALSAVLGGTAAAVRALAAASGGVLGDDLRLLCAVQRVTGVPAGWYRCPPGGGALVPAGRGTGPGVGATVQRALFAASVNLELAAFTVHVAGAARPWTYGRGVRGYREQQLAVGAAVEALTLLAAAVGLGSHPVLGFDVGAVEEAYGLGGGLGVHAQVSVGPVRPDIVREIAVRPV